MPADRLYLLNRALKVTADGWIHIVPKGDLPNPAAGVVQVLDDVALDSIHRHLETEKAQLGNRWTGLYAGREHFIYDEDQDSAALAWFKDFEKRSDGIWANADGLTPVGKQVIANGSYKFTSFTADREDCAPLTGNRVRVMKIDTIGFTNQANGKELLTPITNRAAQTPPPSAAVAKPAIPPALVGKRIYDSVVKLVCNRLRQDFRGYDMGHALVSTRNKDLFESPYGAMQTSQKFAPLVERVMNRAGLSPVRATERSADDLSALTKRFMPGLVDAPAAMQFDALWRAVAALDSAGIADRLCNRTLSAARVLATRTETNRPVDEVSRADWKKANASAEDVLALLDSQVTRPIDRGAILENSTASHVRSVFRNAIDRMMREQGLDRRQAFDRLKADEPIFWTLAILSFDPDLL